jgi:hypothetical protein
MKKLIQLLNIAAIAALFAPVTTFGQSGGNFVSTVENTVCTVNSMNGVLGCTGPNCSMFTASGGGSLVSTIKLPNSSPGLLVTPSLVTGLYTNTLSSNTTSSQTAAIVVTVTDAQTGYSTVTLTPNQTCVVTDDINNVVKCGVAYDERFQQLMTTNFTNNATVDLILSTLSAHSFNFTRGNVPGGFHTITLNWYFGCDDGTGTLRTSSCASTLGPNTAAACAGPGNLTVQQVQNFKQDKQGIGTTGTVP